MRVACEWINTGDFRSPTPELPAGHCPVAVGNEVDETRRGLNALVTLTLETCRPRETYHL